MPVLALKAAAAVIAAGVAAVGGHAELAGHSQSAATQSTTTIVRVYIVRPGDTLYKIATEFCGNGSRFPSLAAASGIANPNMISVGQRIILSCYSAARATVSSSSRSPSGSNYAAGSAVIPGTNGIYSWAGLYRLWIAAGGNPAHAATATCIAERESGGRPWAISPTNDYGLWQIHNGGSAMLVPFSNAQRAIAMSGNGTNWSQWTTHRYCGM